MIYLAELNQNGICIGVKTVISMIEDDNHVIIDNPDFDFYSFRKYENNQWSNDKFEPVSTAPISEFEQLKSDNLTALEALAEVYEMLLGLI